MLTCASSIAPAPGSGSRSTTHPAVGLRCSPWRSISRYNVVRSTPAMRAAFDMFPLARLTSQVRYCRSKSEEHTSELQSRSDLVCRLLLEKKKYTHRTHGV